MFSICEIKDENDYVIEGYHIAPQLVNRLNKNMVLRILKLYFLLRLMLKNLLVISKRAQRQMTGY